MFGFLCAFRSIGVPPSLFGEEMPDSLQHQSLCCAVGSLRSNSEFYRSTLLCCFVFVLDHFLSALKRIFFFPLQIRNFSCCSGNTRKTTSAFSNFSKFPPHFPSPLSPFYKRSVMVFVVALQSLLLGSRCCGAPQGQEKFRSVPVEAGELRRPAGSAQQ